MKNKKTNFKQNLNAVCDKVIRMILYSPGCENSILGIFVVLFNYAYTIVENRKKKVLRTFFNARLRRSVIIHGFVLYHHQNGFCRTPLTFGK